MQDLLKTLAQYRQLLSETHKQEQNLLEVLQNDPLYRLYQHTASERLRLVKEVTALESRVRVAALDEWNKTDKSKKKFDGWSVKVYSGVRILDEKKAKIWAANNAPSVLSLAKDFGDVVGRIEVDFLERYDDERIAINSDLSDFLESEK